MNRWRHWAQQMRRQHSWRRRHGRRELGRTGSMVLVSRPRFVAQMLFADRQTVVHLHTRISVTHRPSLQMLGGRIITHTLTSTGAVLQRHSVAAPAPVDSREPATGERGPHVHSGLAFVHRVPSAMNARGEDARARPPALALRELVMQWRRVSPNGVLTRAAIARLRERVVRAELPVAPGPRVLARHVPDNGPSTRARQAIEREDSAPPRSEGTAAMAPAAVVNVDALTSQVIQQLDRRLVAYRERMGRV